MGGKSSSTTIGFRYLMSLHMGLCRGPVDEIVQIRVGDVRAWPVPDGQDGPSIIAQGPGGAGVALYENGESALVDPAGINTASGPVNYDVAVNAPNLFGGDKKEGGVQGTLRLFFGRLDQVVPGDVKSALGGLVPDFRGAFTVFFDGLIASLNPYPKAWKFRVRRVLQGWDGEVWHPELAVVWLANGTIKAMNPAHIVYECLTNRDWGRGFAREMAINDAAFLATAQTLFNENLGLCLAWERQDELGSFIQEVIDHIGGSLYPDPTTGKISLGLLRADYAAADIPLFTYETGLIEVREDDTSARDDLVNEVIVTYHDPIKDEDRQVRLHNLASFQSMKALKSTTTPYLGFPTSPLAARAGQRDLKANGTSLKRYKITLDRRAWRIKPGDVLRISAPDKNIVNAILRAGNISKGDVTNGKIEVDAVIDVFGLAAASFVAEQPPVWTPPDRTAVVAANRLVREATYADLVSRMSVADLSFVQPTVGAISVMVEKPTSGSQNYNVAAKAVGEEGYPGSGAGTFAQTVILTFPIGPYDTEVDFLSGVDLGLIDIGEPIQIEGEICRLDAITFEPDGSGVMTIGRGCTDTLPEAHPAGTRAYFFGSDLGSDEREYSVGETAEVKVLPVTSTQQLDIDLAPADSVLIQARQARPWAPGNLRIDGEPYAALSGPVAGALTITWAHRDRTLIQDILIEHGAADSGPEAGTTYTLRSYSNSSFTSLLQEYAGITANTFNYTTAMMLDDSVGATAYLELFAVRDGLTSYSRYKFAVPRDV